MEALVVTPGTPGSARVATRPATEPGTGEVLLRTLEVGVCGTDREIAAGLFGVAPEGEQELVLGHEVLAEVVEGAGPFSAGDLVASTVRRSCRRCAACAAGSPDSCLTGAYSERGITRLHGFARELASEAPEHLVPIPASVGRLGVLAEPASVCARAIRHAELVGRRQVWEPSRALVLGAGAVGVLTSFFLRLRGYEVWTVSKEATGSEKAALIEVTGAHYVAGTPDDLGGFDLVVEAAGDGELLARAAGLLRRSGVACLLGLDSRPGTVTLDRGLYGHDVVLENRAVLGSVNAHPDDWAAAVRLLGEVKARWPEAAEQLVGLRVEPGRFEEAFGFAGVKATLRFA